MGDRNSYSKTDPDATFMRMKDDHMMNGQLKTGYNVQLSSENQFITNYALYQKTNDTNILILFLNLFKNTYNIQSKTVVADAGYGSLENYEYLEKEKIKPYVKYNYFHKSQKKKHVQNPYVLDNLFYNEDEDYYVCPMGQHMINIGSKIRKTATSYEYKVEIYKAQNCNKCPLGGLCHKSKFDRVIEVNTKLNKHKTKVKELLNSQEGIKHGGKRSIEPEAVFGHIKANNKFTRFFFFGINKTELEFGLMAIGHNFRKLTKV